jgi:hypothetical protein
MLWSINNEAKLAAWAKQKNKDQQRDMELVEMARNETDLEKARSMGSLGNQELERIVADNSLLS